MLATLVVTTSLGSAQQLIIDTSDRCHCLPTLAPVLAPRERVDHDDRRLPELTRQKCHGKRLKSRGRLSTNASRPSCASSVP
jgi:hypothetical protein